MKEILRELNEKGYEAYVVGGYVRDYLLGISSNDIDIATNAPINKIMSIFKGRGTAFKEYYSFHMNEGDNHYDITTYRKELKYKKNKPTELEVASSLKEDLLRRDFTINTFAINNDFKLVDLLGAKKDLDSKIIRVVGDTVSKFTEDKTRILRAIRFYCTLDFDLHPDILKFLGSKKTCYLNEVTNEFKKSELDKIFDSDNVSKFFFLLKRYKLSKYLGISNYDEIKDVYNKYGVWAQIETSLPMSNKDKKIIKDIKTIVEKGDIYFYDVMHNSDEIIYNAASILGLTEKVKVIKDTFKLHSILDIDMDFDLMFRYVKLDNFKKVYRDIERNIIEGYLENNRDSIEEYLRYYE